MKNRVLIYGATGYTGRLVARRRAAQDYSLWLVALLFPAVKTGQNHGNDHSPSPPEILKERYAKGELTTAQYREMLEIISPSAAPDDHY
jgi:nucleoside-diphosphate-sugar epimerase